MHLVLAFVIFGHVVLGNKHLFVEEAFATSMLFEALRNPVVTIANDRHTKVVFGEVSMLVSLRTEAIVVVHDTTKRRFQLVFIFVVHSDADGHCRWSTSLLATTSNVRQKASCHLDMPRLTVFAETCASNP